MPSQTKIGLGRKCKIVSPEIKVTLSYIQVLRIKSWQLFSSTRLIDSEETWKYTKESGWC
jgi:hypothetical protein